MSMKPSIPPDWSEAKTHREGVTGAQFRICLVDDATRQLTSLEGGNEGTLAPIPGPRNPTAATSVSEDGRHTRRSVKSQTVALLPIGADGRLRHHSATAKT